MRIVFVSIFLLLGGVAHADPPVARERGSALILQGLDVDWHARPHRLRVLGAGFGASGAGAKPEGTMWAEVQGGSWASGRRVSDVPTVHATYAGLATADRPVLVGSTTLHLAGTVRLAGNKRVPATAIADVAVPVHGSADTAAVWLSGFRIATTPAPPNGFTVHALSVEVGPPSVDAGMLRFPVSGLVQAAPVPDRGQKLDTYGADVVVDWVAVPARASEVHEIQARADLGRGLAAIADAERGSVARRGLAWTGFPGVHVAITAMVLALRDGESAWAGRWTPSFEGATRATAPYPGP